MSLSPFTKEQLLPQEEKLEIAKQKSELFLDNDPKTINEAQVYFYYFDKDNYLEKITVKENNKEVIVEKIKELEFDAIGNATKSFKIKLPSNQQYLITRNFEYYN